MILGGPVWPEWSSGGSEGSLECLFEWQGLLSDYLDGQYDQHDSQFVHKDTECQKESPELCLTSAAMRYAGLFHTKYAHNQPS